jgi:hypothetical protein
MGTCSSSGAAVEPGMPGDIPAKWKKKLADTYDKATNSSRKMFSGCMLNLVELERTQFWERVFASAADEKPDRLNCEEFSQLTYKYALLELHELTHELFHLYKGLYPDCITLEEIKTLIVELHGAHEASLVKELLNDLKHEHEMEYKAFDAYMRHHIHLMQPAIFLTSMVKKHGLHNKGETLLAAARANNEGESAADKTDPTEKKQKKHSVPQTKHDIHHKNARQPSQKKLHQQSSQKKLHKQSSHHLS